MNVNKTAVLTGPIIVACQWNTEWQSEKGREKGKTVI